MKFPLFAYLATVTLAANALGGTILADFESFALPSEIAGTGLWTINDNTPKLSFTVDWNGYTAAALGGKFDAPVVASVGLDYPYAETIGVTTLSFDFTIVDSVNKTTGNIGNPPSPYPSRDIFSVGFTNGGSDLFKIVFTPHAQDPNPQNSIGQWDLSYVVGNGGPTTLTEGVLEGGTYALSLGFSANGSSTDFGLTVAGGTTEHRTGTLAINPATVADAFRLGYTPTKYYPSGAGNNFFVMDNLVVVPEPSVATLACLTACGLFLRRRRHA